MDHHKTFSSVKVFFAASFRSSIGCDRVLLKAAISTTLLTVGAFGQTAGTFALTGYMNAARDYHTATLLRDGRVLIAGAESARAHLSAELYDPSTRTFSPTGEMIAGGAAAALLSDGRVLMVGVQSAALYDPSTGTFSRTGDLVTRQGGFSATVLTNGKVLISGGSLSDGITSAAPEVYDPVTGTFAPAGNSTASQWSSRATLLNDGNVLLTGGFRWNGFSLYDPTLGTFTVSRPLPLVVGLWAHSSTLLADGTVLIAGGRFFSGSDFYNDYGEEALATAVIYDPASGRFQNVGSLLQARDDHTATLLPGGQVLVAGGDWNFIKTLASAELYDPTSHSFTNTGVMNVSRVNHTATLLLDGTVLIAGGIGERTAEIYVPPLRALSAESLPSGMAGTGYGSVPFSAVGGLGGYVWSATGLPSGMTMSVDGALSGIPAVGSAGSYNPQFTVTDSANDTASVTISLIISGPPPSISSIGPNPVRGLNGNQTLFINGTAFQNGAGLLVRIAQPSGQIDVSPTFNSSDQLVISIDTGTASATWTAQVINPDGQSSNQLSFPIVSPSTTTFLTLPHFVFGGAWYTALYFANTTDLVAHVQVNFYENDGTPLNVPLVGIGFASSRSIDLSPHSTIVLEMLNGGSSGEGWMEASLPLGVTGHAVFRQTVSGRPDQEAVVPLAPETSSVADLTYDDILFTTAVAFLNPTGLAETVTIDTFDANGTSTGSTQVALPPRSKMSDALKSVGGLGGIAGHRGRAVFSVTNGAVSVLGLRFGGSAFTSIPVVHRPALAETRTISYSLPQFAFNGAWYTALYFSNTTNAPLNIPVSFIADNGTPLNSPLAGVGSVTSRTVSLKPGATAILEFLADSATTVVEGWGEATLPPGAIGYAVFRQTVAGRPDQEAVAPLTSESSQTADLVYDDILFTTAVALLNPSDQQITVTVTVYSANGSQLGVAQIPLAPHTKVATLLRDVPGLSSISGNRGWATFSVPNGDVSILGLRFGGSAFTSIPVGQ